MQTIAWQQEYSVGVQELDEQHRGLLSIINTVITEQQESYRAAQFSAALGSLIHYAYTHFATEERYLIAAHFPDLEKHILQHIDFIIKTLGLALRVGDGDDAVRLELLAYLKEWYSSHVLGIDRAYIPYVAANRKA